MTRIAQACAVSALVGLMAASAQAQTGFSPNTPTASPPTGNPVLQNPGAAQPTPTFQPTPPPIAPRPAVPPLPNPTSPCVGVQCGQ